MMKTTRDQTNNAGDLSRIDEIAFVDLLRRRAIPGVDRVSAPSSVRRRAYAKAIVELRSLATKSMPPTPPDSVRNAADSGSHG